MNTLKTVDGFNFAIIAEKHFYICQVINEKFVIIPFVMSAIEQELKLNGET
jgi:hypothetical protein